MFNDSEYGNNSIKECLVLNENTLDCDGEEYHSEVEGLYPPSSGLFWIYLCSYGVLVMFAGELDILHVCMDI